MPNPYEAPTADVAAQRGAALPNGPQRDWSIWIATAAILLLCLASGATGVALVLLWAGVQIPGPFAELAGSKLLEPLGAGGLSVTVIALAFGYGQLKAVFNYDLVWTRTLVAALFMASTALVIATPLLAGRVSAGLLLAPALGTLLLGLCMGQWHRRLRVSRLASPRPIVPRRGGDVQS